MSHLVVNPEKRGFRDSAHISADGVMGSNITTNASLDGDVSMERILYNVRAVRQHIHTLIHARAKQKHL